MDCTCEPTCGVLAELRVASQFEDPLCCAFITLQFLAFFEDVPMPDANQQEVSEEQLLDLCVG